MNFSRPRFLTRTGFLLCIVFTTIGGCKKSNDSAGSSGISATINGKSWQSSVTTGLYSNGILGLYGFLTGDKSQLLISFQEGFTVGQPDAYIFSNIQYSLGDGTIYSSYAMLNSTGSLTLNSLDTVNKKATGVFYGVFYNGDNSKDSVVVTNGRFNLSYTVQ